MKKLFYSILLLTTIILPIRVNAGLKTNVLCDEKKMDETLTHQIKTCYIDVTVTDDTSFYSVAGKFTMINTSLKGNIESGDKRIKITNTNLDNLTFVSETPIKNETIRIAKFTIFLAENGKECKVTWQPITYGINYSCKMENGYYYDKNGNSVSELEYNKQCKPHSCEIIDETYFDKEGNIVSKDEYSIQCETHSCEVIGDKYFNKEGNIVSKDEYSIQCETHSCKIINGVYFGKDGKIVTDLEYDKQCNKHYCKIIDKTHFGKNGDIISKAEYDIQCPTKSPSTSTNSIIGYILIGLLITTFASIMICLKQNKKKVYKI